MWVKVSHQKGVQPGIHRRSRHAQALGNGADGQPIRQREQGTDVLDTTGITGLDSPSQVSLHLLHGCLTKRNA
jgi:hypothetical protein